MPDSDFIDSATVDPELLPGARNAVRTCLSVEPDDEVVLIADEPTRAVAAAILVELRQAGAAVSTFVLERQGERPLKALPRSIAGALGRASVSLMVVRPEPGELQARVTVMERVNEGGLRHAHMPGVTEKMMMTGMRADFRKVARLQERLLARLSPDCVVRVASPAGTDLEVTFTAAHRWIRGDGIIKPGEWQNLPGGQLYTTPANAEGVFVADGAIGEWFAVRYPDLEAYPVTVDISGGRAMDARSSSSSLARQLMVYVRSNPGGDRVGEFAIGTNLALDFFLGNALQDENVPGSHLALGGAAVLASTGAKWTARTHLPLIARKCDIDIDGSSVMREGIFTEDLLSGL